MSQERDRVLGHADDNDGIDEYDNQLPPWWTFMFFFTVVWGIGYAVDYHFISKRSQAASYEAEMLAAAEQWPEQESAALAGPATEADLKAGKEVYDTHCVACHGAKMEGGIGPSFLDAEWIHGGELADIVRVVNEGVPDKGMITWGPILGPEKVAQVSVYVHDRAQKATP